MKRLQILVKWLKAYTSTYDERDGVLERAIKQSKEDSLHQIGDYIEEILMMSEEQINDELDENEAIVKISIATVCGSDVHSWLGHRPFPTPCI